MKRLMHATAALALVLAASPALAEHGERHSHDPGVNARQHHQQERIQQGVRSGELTRGEAKQLRHEERGVRQEEREYKSDGKLTRDERRDLHHDMNEVSRDIHEEKHDAERR